MEIRARPPRLPGRRVARANDDDVEGPPVICRCRSSRRCGPANRRWFGRRHLEESTRLADVRQDEFSGTCRRRRCCAPKRSRACQQIDVTQVVTGRSRASDPPRDPARIVDRRSSMPSPSSAEAERRVHSPSAVRTRGRSTFGTRPSARPRSARATRNMSVNGTEPPAPRRPRRDAAGRRCARNAFSFNAGGRHSTPAVSTTVTGTSRCRPPRSTDPRGSGTAVTWLCRHQLTD